MLYLFHVSKETEVSVRGQLRNIGVTTLDINAPDCLCSNEVDPYGMFFLYEYDPDILSSLRRVGMFFRECRYICLCFPGQDVSEFLNQGFVHFLGYLPLEEGSRVFGYIKGMPLTKSFSEDGRMRDMVDRSHFLNYKSMITSFYIYDLIYGDISKLNLMKDYIEDLDLDISPDCVMTLMVDEFWEICRELDNKRRYYIKKECLQLTIDAIREYELCAIACTLIGTDKLVILCNSSKARPYELAQKVLEHIHRHSAYSVTIGIGRPYRLFSDIWKSYEEAFQALNYSFFLGNKQIILFEDLTSSQSERTSHYNFESFKYDFFRNFGLDRDEEPLTLHDKLFEHFILNRINRDVIKALLVNFMFEVAEFAVSLGGFEEVLYNRVLELNSKILRTNSIIAIKDFTREYIEEVLCELRKSRSGDRELALESAILFIEKYYYKDISLSDVAYVANMSESYFSRRFKRKFEINFSKYLLECRLKKSVDLLRDRSLSIETVAEMVGFKDSSYFSKAFKSAYGCSPLKYREKNEVP
ncbi:MAG: helix-turn-helix domain-containing protein [Filifactor alocis]|nr:helix-turn-helix domain-containing protein [Filifactor alocis]